jgi:MoaA/NifB/PqqE/SkfB family radical SAM enzyme
VAIEVFRMKLPDSVCFRVTRNCNARCTFCLAPPDGPDPDFNTLCSRLDTLLDHGVRRIHLCGGEPTVHPDFPRLLAYASSRGAGTSLCTNGLLLPGALLPLLQRTATEVRVSLHGDRARHDAIVGSGCHHRTILSIERLQRAGIATSIQTTAVAAGTSAVEWVIAFCLERGLRRLSVLPFVPRGKGADSRGNLALPGPEQRLLRDLIRSGRRELAGRLDLRWVDLSIASIPVVEPDGRVVLEGATESRDREIFCMA